MQRRFWSTLAVLVMTAVLGARTALAAGPPTGPSPSLDPSQTVAAMLAALKKNSDRGLAELFNFSSPGNKAKTGPLKNFEQLMHQAFPDMLGHRAARQAPPIIQGGRAMIAVEMVGSDQEMHHYGFLLSKQTIPACNGCWMADAVVNLDNQGGEGDDDDDGDDDDGAPDGPGQDEPASPLTTPT